VDGDSYLKVKGYRYTAVEGWDVLQVNGNLVIGVRESAGIRVKEHASLTSEGKATIVASEISLGANDSNFIRIGPSGVTIVGTVVNINSGGSRIAGFGGVPPELPDAEKAAPTAPAAADDAKSGQKSS
jgi:type VI secretion system secreted protein VgrG